MRRETLLDFFADLSTLEGDFLVFDDGFRTRTWTYSQFADRARWFAERLAGASVGQGHKVILWGENRPAWLMAFWGAVLRGAVLVPIDFRASADLLARVEQRVQPRLILVGEDVTLPAGARAAEVWSLAELETADRPAPSHSPRQATATHTPTPDDVAEIIFTSGATAEPKGVLITHRNILANIVPVEREVLKYRKYGRPFRPVRFLNLLPLSHMFGQSMATFVPPMLPGVVVFMRSFNPADIVRQIKTRRVSVLVCVPKMLDVLREYVLRRTPDAASVPETAPPHWLGRWWRYRKTHRLFGWKFWSFVVGAAPLDPALEEFWGRLGFLVIQGYGLTETAPIVTLNHPFRARKGTVGAPIAGVEVKIAPDGEILVRGENVTSGYYEAPTETAEAFAGGWFHTGDLGSLDEAGRLVVRGRKKEVIVTPEGLNVFPEDVERALERQPGVRESAVVGVASGSEERVHAVVVLEPGTDLEKVIRDGNRELEDHQKIRGASIWPDATLPRTEGTGKLKRGEIKRWVSSGGTGTRRGSGAEEDAVESVLHRFTGARQLTAGTTLEELGLTSLERIELIMALEERFQTTIDETTFSGVRDVRDLKALVEQHALPVAEAAAEPIDFPSWNRTAIPRLLRRISLPTWILPPARVFAWPEVSGLEHLSGISGPVIFASNHQSHMDTPMILWVLPSRWRYRVAPAMAKEFFKGHFFPDQHTRKQWFTSSLNYYLSALFFNAFPLPQREAGARQTLRYAGELLSEGFSILIYPEGKRTERGEINHFRPGIGMMAARLGVPVVPVRLEGLDKVLHQEMKMAKPGRIRITFGEPMQLSGEDYVALARRVEDAVRAL